MKLTEVGGEDTFEEGEIIEDAAESKPNVEIYTTDLRHIKSPCSKSFLNVPGADCMKNFSSRSHRRHKDRSSGAVNSTKGRPDVGESHNHSKSFRRSSLSTLSDGGYRNSDHRPHGHGSKCRSEYTDVDSRYRHSNRSERKRSSSSREKYVRHSTSTSKSKSHRDHTPARSSKARSPKRHRNGTSHKRAPEMKRIHHEDPPGINTRDEHASGLRSGSDNKELDGIPAIDEEERLIEERRRRRVEILIKHGKASRNTTLQDDGVVEIARNADVPDYANIAVMENIPQQEKTFSQTDAHAQAKCDELKQDKPLVLPITVATPDAPSPLEIDMGIGTSCVRLPSDDMFELREESFDTDKHVTVNSKDTKSTSHIILENQALLQNAENLALTDNWDDSEGYYCPVVGEKLEGRYIVLGMLGKGVFSSVVRTSDIVNNGEEVAVKIIRNNETMYRAGIKELSIFKKLMASDPRGKKHIVRLLRHFEYRNHLCLVFENMCMNLRDVLKKFGRDVGLNIKAVRVYAQQLLIALSLLRKCGILHADIKPDNILVSKSKNILKLCDLGSALEATDTEITPYLVSRFYRAPEVRLPHNSSLDVWSVACTLYELYTGRFLFPGRSNNQMLKLMMDLKGKIPNKVLRKGKYTHKHFDVDLNFVQTEVDEVTGKEVKRKAIIARPARDLRTLIEVASADVNEYPGKSKEDAESEVTILSQFIDFLDKALHLNPEKRLTVSEALVQPFINITPAS